MELSLFQWINIILIVSLAILFLRYIYIRYDEKGIHQDDWKYQKKSGAIPAELQKLERKYPDKARFYGWWLQIGRLKREKVPGVFIEVGVYKGESAVILNAMDPERELYLFDSFSGFSPKDLEFETGEAATYTPEHFSDTSMEMVRKLFAGKSGIHIRQGHFPESAARINLPVALLNLDADLYQPTISALEMFYPLVSPGGVILIHDYNYKWPGIVKAVDEFQRKIPENLVLIPDDHGTVVIVKNK